MFSVGVGAIVFEIWRNENQKKSRSLKVDVNLLTLNDEIEELKKQLKKFEELNTTLVNKVLLEEELNNFKKEKIEFEKFINSNFSKFDEKLKSFALANNLKFDQVSEPNNSKGFLDECKSIANDIISKFKSPPGPTSSSILPNTVSNLNNSTPNNNSTDYINATESELNTIFEEEEKKC
ncbi:hypothetical protein HK099_003470 [Clydaea vesicula]|uniref:Uncharacterized protein n=1 Tax=Clydaea vesicula TaxID=447962 RepID=A0AAD5TS10_9FUNG|nr:hypothetical protein HK099_003470 [Clydaea vesicula]